MDPFGWQSCTNSAHKSWAYRLGHALGSLLYGNPGGPPPDSYAALRDEELGPSDFDFADLAGVTADVAGGFAEAAAPFLIPEAGIAEEAGADIVEVAEAADSGLSGTALARQLGQAGEDAVGITGPKTGITIPGSGITRFPDQLTSTTLTEVKNVQNLSFTQQLRDYSAYVQQNPQLTFELWVRPSTQLSGPLLQARDAGLIVIKYIQGAK